MTKFDTINKGGGIHTKDAKALETNGQMKMEMQQI